MTTSTTSIDIMGLQAAYANLHTDQECDYFMQRYHDVISSFGGKTSYDLDFLKVRCRLALLPFLISCLIWLDLVASLSLIKERILVIILLLHFLSLMLGSVLVLMLPLLVWLTPDLRIKKSLLKCNWTIRKRLPRCKMRLKKRLLAFSRRLHARI